MHESSNPDLKSLELLMDTMPIAVSWARVSDEKILYMNRAFTRLFGYGLAELKTVPDWFNTYPDEEQKRVAFQRWRTFQEQHDGREVVAPEIEIRVQSKDGHVVTSHHEAVFIPKLGLAIATFVDISERRGNEIHDQEVASQKLHASQLVQAMFSEHAQEMIVVSPMDRRKRYVSGGVLYLTGFSSEEYLAQGLTESVHPADWPKYLEVISKAHHGEPFQQGRYRILQKKGGYRWVEAQVRAWFDPETGLVLGYIANIRNVAEQQDHEEAMAVENIRLSDLAATDELTGIANRRSFNELLTVEMIRERRPALSLALVLVDIDHYKGYNDHLGHVAGDLCLQKVAVALRSLLLRSSDVVARFGGDEFVLLLPLTDLAGAEKIAGDAVRAILALAIPDTRNIMQFVTVSAGVACCPDSLPAIQNQLLLQADKALYVAKQNGRNTYSVSLCEELGP